MQASGALQHATLRLAFQIRDAANTIVAIENIDEFSKPVRIH